MPSAIIIHGGIKEFENISGQEEEIQEALREIAAASHALLIEDGARAAVVQETFWA